MKVKWGKSLILCCYFSAMCLYSTNAYLKGQDHLKVKVKQYQYHVKIKLKNLSSVFLNVSCYCVKVTK